MHELDARASTAESVISQLDESQMRKLLTSIINFAYDLHTSKNFKAARELLSRINNANKGNQ